MEQTDTEGQSTKSDDIKLLVTWKDNKLFACLLIIMVVMNFLCLITSSLVMFNNNKGPNLNRITCNIDHLIAQSPTPYLENTDSGSGLDPLPFFGDGSNMLNRT